LEASRGSAHPLQIHYIATDQRADDRHRVIDGAEAADNDDVAVLDECRRLVLTHQHFLAFGSVYTGDRFELHGFSSRTRKSGVSFSVGSAITLVPMAGGSVRL